MGLGGVLASVTALLMLLGRPATGKGIIDMDFCGEDDCYKVGVDGQGCVYRSAFPFLAWCPRAVDGSKGMEEALGNQTRLRGFERGSRRHTMHVLRE